MILNKNKYIFLNTFKFMFNLQQFQYSNVTKKFKNSNTNPISIKQNQKIEIVQEQSLNIKTVNIPVKQQKNKSKKLKNNPIQVYTKISQWRKKNIAPVDTMGCERLSQPNQTEQIKKYQILVSLMLSVQTTDQITSMVVKRLQQYQLTPQKIASTPQQKLIELIHESNFNKRKAKNIIEVSKIILQKGLPKNKQQLLELPGIGIKIAMIYLRVAEGLQDGIGVDTHVHRISNKLGWVQTSNPNQTEQKLQQLFPKKYWTQMNIDLVGFGQLICNAKKPLCNQCPVNNQCPSSFVKNNKLQW